MGIKLNRRLELREDPVYQRRFWRVQNAGWVVMVVFLLAGMLGLLGGAGPLASTTSGDGTNHLTIEYPRFLRNRAPVDLDMTIAANSVTSNEVAIVLNRSYIQRFDIQYINPEPSEVRSGDETMTYVFTIEDPARDASLTFTMQPERFGLATARIGLEGEQPVEIWQLIYP